MANSENCLKEVYYQEFLKADKNLSKKTIQFRLLRRILKKLEISFEDLKHIIDSDTVFVNPQISSYLSENLPAMDEEVAKKFFSKDYHEKGDVEAFCNLMEEKISDKNGRFHLNYVFAVDGFRGSELKNYMDNLRRAIMEDMVGPDWEETNGRDFDVREQMHVRAVRHLYETFGAMIPEVLRIGIQNALDKKKSTDFYANKITDAYTRFVSVFLDGIKDFIESKYVCFTENV